MELKNLKANDIIHKKGDIITTIDIVLKGVVSVTTDNGSYTLESGSLIGICGKPGFPFEYDFKAENDVSIASYPYTKAEDIAAIIDANPKLSYILATQSIKSVVRMFDETKEKLKEASSCFEKLNADRQEYPLLSVSVGTEVKNFPKLNYVAPFEGKYPLPEWKYSFYRALSDNLEKIKSIIASISGDVAKGIVIYAAYTTFEIADAEYEAKDYLEQFNSLTEDFYSEIQLIKARSDELKRNGEEGQSNDIDIKDALNTILRYSDAKPEICESFKKNIIEFKNNPNRYDSSDETRALRRRIAQDYYPIYTAVFLKSLSDPSIPSEIMMFLMFGFVDEELAGLENTRQLYVFAKSYEPDPSRLVFTAYEWLKKIYYLECEPSRNEFDEDYFTALRTLKTNGDITQDQMEKMKDDPVERLKFEINNLLALGNRMTYGRPSVFVPVFDKENVTKPLDKAYVDYKAVLEFYDNIKNIDYSVFCRQGVYSNPDIGINQVFLDEDVTPYMILMPNIGSRSSLWQEIEGKKRNTPARFIISIFHIDSFEDNMTKLCGEFRWEMCKTEQGVHWNDVSDPSLTSMYCDYLQFYKKNHFLSADTKEKLKTQLQKFNNNYKNVFISDYITYIKFEANASLRLNKTAREILFTFCPFPEELRAKMNDNPQYAELIKKHAAHQSGLMRPLSNLMVKLNNDGISVPPEILKQYEYYKK